jgi:hypothetical protein
MNALNDTYIVEQIAPSGIIAPMPELDEMITVTQAVDLANGRYTRRHITHVVKNGDIPGAKRIGNMWLIPKTSFEEWLHKERRPGPKTSV